MKLKFWEFRDVLGEFLPNNRDDIPDFWEGFYQAAFVRVVKPRCIVVCAIQFTGYSEKIYPPQLIAAWYSSAISSKTQSFSTSQLSVNLAERQPLVKMKMSTMMYVYQNIIHPVKATSTFLSQKQSSGRKILTVHSFVFFDKKRTTTWQKYH